jgi:hypothetical protein
MDAIFLDIPDIKGQSTIKGFEDKIEILSASHGVAMQITGSPSAARPWKSMGAMRPVSSTILSQAGAVSSTAAMASGVLEAFASRATAPSRSTTQMWVSVIETSRPA